MEKIPDIHGLERELDRKFQTEEINFEQFMELLHDVIRVQIDVQYPEPAGLPREDRNPVRLYRKLLLESQFNSQQETL